MMPSPPLDINIVQAQTEQELERYYEFRWRILRAPWNQPLGSERDDLESTSTHLIACDNKNVTIGVARLHKNTPVLVQIRYMAVEEPLRKRGIGSALLRELEAIALAQGATSITLNARESVTGFYEKHGYRINGSAPTLFETIRHFRMTKTLS